MATAEKAKLEYEGGQQVYPVSELTDSGDRTTFTSSAEIWSGVSGYAPVILPNGILTGGAITVGASDQVSVAAATCNLNGSANAAVAADAVLALTRPATDVSKVNSITIDSTGDYVVIAGTDGATSAFVETRGAAGGPPYIPVDSIEVGQVRLTASASAVVAESEILQIVGLHQERADFPQYNAVYSEGSVEFIGALPAIHTGDEGKAVYASFAEPIFGEIALASDFVPPETTHSVNSTQVYNTTIASASSTLGQGSFTAYLNDGISDPLMKQKNNTLWFRFYPDRFKTPYMLTQGVFGVSRTFPAGDQIQAACTVTASETALERES